VALVADELERRWNQALERVREIEQRIAQHTESQDEQPAPTLEDFSGLAEQLEALWQHPDTDARLKNRSCARSSMRSLPTSTRPRARSCS